jgi:hypothetical protein
MITLHRNFLTTVNLIICVLIGPISVFTQELRKPQIRKQNNVYPYNINDLDTKANAILAKKELEIAKAAAAKAVKCSKLKAVLIVGPQEKGTAEAIMRMSRIASFLSANNIKVYTFYDKNTDWKSIVRTAKDADIFIYAGHGNEECGLVLKENIEKDSILKDLKLNKNALVIFQSVCYGAGSSATDYTDIGKDEAVRRVNAYADLFFNCGVGCYYAINTVGGSETFLRNFFNESDVKSCFKISCTYKEIESNTYCNFNSGYNMGLASSFSCSGLKLYNIAYISKPGYELSSMFNK